MSIISMICWLGTQTRRPDCLLGALNGVLFVELLEWLLTHLNCLLSVSGGYYETVSYCFSSDQGIKNRVDQKVHMGFSIQCNGKPQTNFWANPMPEQKKQVLSELST